MKINFLTTLAILFLATNIFAIESGIYVEVGVGTGTKEQLKAKKNNYDYDTSYLGSLYLGYQAGVYRFELEDSYKSATLKDKTFDSDVTQNTQMLNIYYSGYNKSKMVTTLGLGAGISSIEVNGLKNSNIFSYQAMFSIGYMKTKHFIITPKYSYMRMVKSDNFDRNSDHLLSLNLRYLF